jgi:uncharacterized membrane protein YgcG
MGRGIVVCCLAVQTPAYSEGSRRPPTLLHTAPSIVATPIQPTPLPDAPLIPTSRHPPAALPSYDAPPPPLVLVIHLKRFDGFLGGKISGHVAFPEALDLGPFMSCRKRAPRRWQRPRCGGSGSGSGSGSSSAGDSSSGDGGGGAAGEGDDEQQVEVGRSVYRLHGVLVHAGVSATSGHYYSFVRDGLLPNNGWWCANDSSIYR